MDGGVDNRGDAPFSAARPIWSWRAPVVAMAAAPDGEGYWWSGADGSVLTYGRRGYYQSADGAWRLAAR